MKNDVTQRLHCDINHPNLWSRSQAAPNQKLSLFLSQLWESYKHSTSL